ncbi:MAG: PIN domain-containing protein [Deltaproteobacteria bacterium]|nr:PIN domain-containing protein [Deltaproteobacteria bacterium]
MSVLVDTPIWSLALRRHPHQLNPTEQRLIAAWVALVQEGHAYLMGPIRQELLSGIRHAREFARLRAHLAPFPDLPLITSDYECAAEFFNRCRSKGITGTPVDLLLCAIAHRFRLPIFTTDQDFARYAKRLPIRLY